MYLLTRLGQTMEERPVIGTNLTDPETGEPVLKDRQPGGGHQGPQRLSGREPESHPDVGIHVRRPVHRPRHHLRHHDPERAAGRSQGDHQLPDAPLRLGLDLLGRGPSKDPQLYDPNDRDKLLVIKRPYSEIRGVPTTPDVVYDVPRDANGKAIIADRRNDQTLILLRASRGPADVPQQARGPRAEEPVVRAVPRAVGLRVGPSPGPVALPVDGHPRLPARHRGQGHDRLGVQGGADRGSDHQPQVLPDHQPAGASLYPGRVLGGRVPLRPQHRPAAVHGPRLHRHPDPRHGGRLRASRCSRPSRPTTT